MAGITMVKGYKMAPQDPGMDYAGYGRDFADARGLFDPVPALNGVQFGRYGGCAPCRMGAAEPSSGRGLLGLALVGAFLWWMAD
jgi:MYXO-CTERM domain-containing protein